MLGGIRLGTSSALRGSTARTRVVSFASLEPVDASVRKQARSAGLSSISLRLSQPRSLVPGLLAAAGPASPLLGEHPAATATTNATRTAASSVPSLSDRPDPASAPVSSYASTPTNSDTISAAHPEAADDHAVPAEQRSASAAPTPSTLPRGTSRLHIHTPNHVPHGHVHSHGSATPAHRHAPAHHQHYHPKRTRHPQHHHQPDSIPGHPHHLHHSHQRNSAHHATPAAAAAAHRHHPTLRLIASRLRSGSKPGARADGARLGLVVEGGGMRGCISGAMLMALHDLGCTDVFDAVYGASAGAINATYYLSGQRHGLRIYHEDLTQGSAFLNFRNLFSGSSRPVMNIDFLIDQVMATSKPLDWDAVLASPTPLKVVASCLDSLRPVLLSDFADRSELAEALKATAAVPQLAGPPRRLRGRTLVDAAVFEPVPVPSAVADGCSHVLVLCTRPAPTRRGPWAKHVRSTLEVVAKTTVLNAPYMRDAWAAARSEPRCCPASKDEQLLAALRSCPHEFRAASGAYVLPVYPDHTAGCHPVCLDAATLMAACDVGRQALMRLLVPVLVGAAADTAMGAAAEGYLCAEGGEGVRVGEEEEEVGLVRDQGLVGLGGPSWAAVEAAGSGGRGGLGARSCTRRTWTCASGRDMHKGRGEGEPR